VFDPDAPVTVSRNYVKLRLAFRIEPDKAEQNRRRGLRDRVVRGYPREATRENAKEREREREREKLPSSIARNVKGRYGVSYCSRYLAAVAIAAILGDRDERSRPVSRVLSGRAQSRNSLEIRDSRHKSTVIRALAQWHNIRPI